MPLSASIRSHLSHHLLAFGLSFALPLSADDSRAGGIAGHDEKEPIVEVTDYGFTLEIDLDQAILMALQNNPAFQAQRLDPSIAATEVEQERAFFDPIIFAQVAYSERAADRLDRTSVTGRSFQRTRRAEGEIGAGTFLPTGTEVTVSAGISEERESNVNTALNQTRLGLDINQALLRGFGTGPNLVRLRQSRLLEEASWFELKGFAQALIAEVETATWQYILAEKVVGVFENALQLSRQRLADTEERIRLGRLPRLELPAVQAEVALQEEGLINAHGARDTARLRLIRLISPDLPDKWELPLAIQANEDSLASISSEAEAHVETAFALRPDLSQAKLAWDRRDLEIVRTRNGLLPRLDAFLSLGLSGYGDTFSQSSRDLSDRTYDVAAGLYLEIPWGNRAARADYDRSRFSLQQATRAIQNLGDLIEEEVRSALIEVRRTHEQIQATRATREFAQATYEAEEEKLSAGRSTNFQVAQAQQELLSSRVAEVRASTAFQLALIGLYLTEGSLLERRGIQLVGYQSLEELP